MARRPGQEARPMKIRKGHQVKVISGKDRVRPGACCASSPRATASSSST